MIRKAQMEDITAIHNLLTAYAQEGKLPARSISQLYDHIRDFWVYEEEETHQVLGCCALEFCWKALAQIRSLAVAPEHTGAGIGSALTERCTQEAFYFQIKNLFILTDQPKFFARFGFTEMDKSRLPLKVWSDPTVCRDYPDCQEVAMEKSF